jgi:glycosyltransferase involved in cell wall biosynthesis
VLDNSFLAKLTVVSGGPFEYNLYFRKLLYRLIATQPRVDKMHGSMGADARRWFETRSRPECGKSSRKPMMKEFPLVSIIIPVYNSSAYLEDALRSALEQDYENKEIIVVDDGSTDSTPTILRSFEDRITILKQTNAGPGPARNRGLKHAKGTYIAFLDADDWWVPEKLRWQVKYLQQHPEVGAVYSRWMCWYPNAEGSFSYPSMPPVVRSPSIVPEDSGSIYTRLLFECCLLTSTVLLRRSVVEEVGLFNEGLLRGQDYDYWLRLSRVSQIHKLDHALALYRQHEDNIVKKYPERNYELIVVENSIARWGLTSPDGMSVSQKKLKHHLSEICFSFGYWHFGRGTARIAGDAFRKCIHYNPLHLKGWIYLVLSGIRASLFEARG